MAMSEFDPNNTGRVEVELLKTKVLNRGSENLNMVSFLILNTWPSNLIVLSFILLYLSLEMPL